MIRPAGRGLDLSETKPVSLSNDPPRRGGRGPYLPETKPVSLSYDPDRRGGRGPGLSETTLFHPRMICPAGQGPHLSETTPCAGWRATGSKSSTGRFLIHYGCTGCTGFFPETAGLYSWTSANPRSIIAGVSVSCVASRPGYPVHPVHPCSIYSPSRLIFPVAGLGCAQRPDSQSASRAAASGPINPVPLVAAQFPCDAAAGRSG